jgi:ribonuclease Z
MVDCGEGTQLQMRKYKVNFNRLTHIFISHLHGDHCFGLIGLISTLDLLGRTGDVFIHADPALKGLLQPQIDFFASHLAFQVHFEDFNPRTSAVIYDDRSLKVTTIPLIHRIACAGFLFEEKQTAAHIIPEMIAFHQIPVKQIADIKAGADYVSPEGKTIPNKHLTRPSESPKRYAYCSDTAYNEKIIPLIEGVDLLFHESTFMEEDLLKAQKTFHSTAKQAATIAQMAKVKELMLGHYSARYNKVEPLLAEAKSIFPNTLLANEGIIKKL